MRHRLEKLGAEVARAQDEALTDDSRRVSVRKRLSEDRAPSQPPLRSHAWRPAIAFAVVTAAALGLLIAWPSTPEPIAYRVNDGPESSQVDQAITAAESRPTPVRFTDGSSIRLAPGAGARVTELTLGGATVELEHGEVMVYVRHRKATRWSVRAGPFLVRVTGTRFRVAWNPTKRSFELEVFEGEVEVSGPDAPTRSVRAGDEVHFAPRPQKVPEPVVPVPAPPSIDTAPDSATPARRPARERAPATRRAPPAPLELNLPPKHPAPPSQGSVEPEPVETTPEQTEPTPEVVDSEPPPDPREPAGEPTWSALFARGEYAEALSRLGAEEIERAIWQADSRELIELGAAARRADDRRAGYIHTVIRSRFAGTDTAADAAFMLGRMEFHAGRHLASVTWFETYLRERPNGRFAREAAGRLVEAYQQGGDEARARAAAERYLARYPTGPHAALARSVLE